MLFLIFSVNARGNVNLLAIILAVLSLLTYTVLAGSVYKTWPLNVIEYTFILDFGILQYTGQGQVTAVYTSVSIAFTKFILIAAFHILTKIKSYY